MIITKTIEIDMAHRVPNHKSKCRNLHGHRYKIEVGVDDKVITTKGSSDEGMVIDFSDLKQIMMEVIDSNFDHGCAVYGEDEKLVNYLIQSGFKMYPMNIVPTAENLAKLWYLLLEYPLKTKNIKLHHVTVWETPTSTATYTLE